MEGRVRGGGRPRLGRGRTGNVPTAKEPDKTQRHLSQSCSEKVSFLKVSPRPCNGSVTRFKPAQTTE